MANYSIKIINQSGASQSYILFQEAPKVQGVRAAQVFTSVYQIAPSVRNGAPSPALFRMRNSFFCVCGTSPFPLALGGTATTSSSDSVSLTQGASSGSLTFMTAPDNEPSWDDSRISTTTSDSGFAIQTDTNFTYPNENNIFIGLGAKDPYDDSNIIPTATFLAHPGEQYTLWPKVKFYVGTGDYEAGTIINSNVIGPTLEVDFSTGLPDQTFIHNANGEFVPQ